MKSADLVSPSVARSQQWNLQRNVVQSDDRLRHEICLSQRIVDGNFDVRSGGSRSVTLLSPARQAAIQKRNQ